MAAELKDTSDRLEAMLQSQIVDRGITDERLLDAMRRVPRDRFFPEVRRRDAYADRATPLAHGQTISQPYVVALMTLKLNVTPETTVLELGTGSGYQTAILAHLAKEVFTIERIKPLLDAAFETLLDLGLRNVRYHWGDGAKGWPDGRTFDRILVTAAPVEMPRQFLLASLNDGGKAVIPVGESDAQQLKLVARRGDELFESDICPVRFVPLLPDRA